jgi:hypothetical protein
VIWPKAAHRVNAPLFRLYNMSEYSRLSSDPDDGHAAAAATGTQVQRGDSPANSAGLEPLTFAAGGQMESSAGETRPARRARSTQTTLVAASRLERRSSGLRVAKIDAKGLGDAANEFADLLAELGASSGGSAVGVKDFTVVCIKGYGSRLDENKTPFLDLTLAELEAEGADVVVWDGDWLKAQSFTSVIPEFLRRDPKRRAIAFRKSSGDPAKMLGSWEEPNPTDFAPTGELASSWPNICSQIGLMLVKDELVVAASTDLENLGVEKKKVANTALGFLSAKVSGSLVAVAVGGGETCEFEAAAWAR